MTAFSVPLSGGMQTGSAARNLNWMGQFVHLAANENGNNLHTDFDHGFHKAVWNAELLEEENAVRFSYHSPRWGKTGSREILT